MIEVTRSSELVPENDLQELWQLSGRVEAVCGWLKSESERDSAYLVRAKDVLAALGK